MKLIRFSLLAAAALFVAACLPVTTKNPVGATVGFKTDAALAGLWKGHGDDDSNNAYFFFTRNADGSMTAVLFTPGKDSDDWGTFTLHTATLGSNRYMNVREALKNGVPSDEEPAKENILMLYALGADGKLTLALLDDKATAEAIKAGKIEGSVDPGSMGDVHITAEPAAQDAFFATKAGAALFGQKFVVLSRME